MGRPGRPRNHDPIADEITRDIRLGVDAAAILARTSTCIDIVDGEARTPLLHAVINGRSDLVSLLIAQGANVDHQDRTGYSALHFAALRNRGDLAELLLRVGASTEVRDVYGNTPLWTAAFNARGEFCVVSALLSNGASLDNRNSAGKTVRDVAQLFFPNDLERLIADARRNQPSEPSGSS